MREAAFWRELRDDFKGLVDHQSFRYLWTGTWLDPGGSTGHGEYSSLTTRFRAFAIRGGHGLGASPEEAVTAWLDLIRSRLPGYFRPVDWRRGVADPDSKPEEYIEFPKDLKKNLITDTDEPTDGDAQEVVVTFHRCRPRDLLQKVEGAGYLISPCQASVDLCMLLEADAQVASAQPTEPQDAVPGEPAAGDRPPLAGTHEAKNEDSPEVANTNGGTVELVSWEHLRLRILSEESLQAYVSNKAGRVYTLEQFGLWDRRGSVGKAKKSWAALRLLGSKGAIPADGNYRQEAQSRAKEIRCVLRRHFTAEGDPLKVEYDNMVERAFDAEGELLKTKYHGGRRYVARFAVDVSPLEN